MTPNIDPETQAIAEAEARATASILGIDVPSITWNGRIRRRLGQAFLLDNRIDLATWLVADHDQLRETVQHEVAHIAAYQLHKDRGHGWAWMALVTGARPRNRFAPKLSPALVEARAASRNRVLEAKSGTFSVVSYSEDGTVTTGRGSGLSKKEARKLARRVSSRTYSRVAIVDGRGEVTNNYLYGKSV